MLDCIPHEDKFPCPVCGHLVYTHMPGHHEQCPICGWEDDLAQLRFPQMPGSANRTSLQNAQINFINLGVTERFKLGQTRKPYEFESRDPEWRLLDEARDNIEQPTGDEDYSLTYPWNDTTVLYYWRNTYWRRLHS